jgi:hypothetical protein
VTLLSHPGRMALFGPEGRASQFPWGGVIADALVYGYTHHPAPLSLPRLSLLRRGLHFHASARPRIDRSTGCRPPVARAGTGGAKRGLLRAADII